VSTTSLLLLLSFRQNPSKIPTQSIILGYIRHIFLGVNDLFGVLLINKFYWATYIFGSFPDFTAMKMLFTTGEDTFEPKKFCV
jgi:tellurite resistance protein TerC